MTRHNTNKFEHLMSAVNREELKTEGKTIVTQPDSRNNQMAVATVSHYITMRIAYSIAKKMLNDKLYCHRRDISTSNYNSTTKTIDVTGLSPIAANSVTRDAKKEIINQFYTYGI